MTSNIDNFFLLQGIYVVSSNTGLLLQNFTADLMSNADLISNIFLNKLQQSSSINTLTPYYIDNYYTNIILKNSGYFLLTTKTNIELNYIYYIFFFIKKFFKLNLFIFIIYTIFVIANFENYIKQQNTLASLAKLFILNASEKEIGPVDDYFFFVILFILTISLFIFTAVSLILLQNSIFIWAIGALFLLTFLVLTIPVRLFIDFGIVFCVTIKGSASSNNIIKELLFDMISTITVFIRFVIQNIRFFFIFSGIFELLEWVLAADSNIFLSTNIFQDNTFINTNTLNNLYYLKNFNFFFINTVLFILFYFYYILHLLFLLLVQVTIYIGISLWLFFFLYSTKFLTKYEKFFIFKKLN